MISKSTKGGKVFKYLGNSEIAFMIIGPKQELKSDFFLNELKRNH